MEREELTHQGLIIVSPALTPARLPHSHLYSGFQEPAVLRKGTAILTLSLPSVRLGRELHSKLPESHLYLPDRFQLPEDHAQQGIHHFQISLRQVLQNAFHQYEAMVCIMASGIVMRELASVLKNKHSDPAVVVMDSNGRYAVSMLSGHEGGANHLAQELAEITGGHAVITTASDTQDMPALDEIARLRGWIMHPRSRLAPVMAALVNDEPVALIQDEGCDLLAGSPSFNWIGRFHRWIGGNRRLFQMCCDCPLPHARFVLAILCGSGCLLPACAGGRSWLQPRDNSGGDLLRHRNHSSGGFLGHRERGLHRHYRR